MDREKHTSKYIREYGLTMKELSNKYNVKEGYIYVLHLKGELHQFIEEQEKKQAVPTLDRD